MSQTTCKRVIVAVLAVLLLAGSAHAQALPAAAQVASTEPEAREPDAKGAEVAGQPVTGVKTLQRQLDPVIVTGKKLPLAQGADPEKFRVFAWDPEAGFSPIPYQFDERDQEGRFVFESGPDSSVYVDDGVIDANDELAFMAADTGHQVPLEVAGEGSIEVMEIELVDPVTQQRGWVYVLPATFSDRVSTRDYVSINEQDLEVTARDYVFRFTPDAPVSFDYLAIRHEDEPALNIVDRLKIRAWSRVLGLVRVNVDEEDLDSELRGYIDGPVRVIRRSRNTYHIAIIPTLRTDLEASFYFSHFDFDLTGKMPINADTFVSHAELRVSVDYNDNVRGATFYTGTYRKGYTFNGKPDGLPKSSQLSRAPYQWGAIYGFGKDGKDGWFSRMIPGPTLPTWFQPFVEDDAERDDSPERVPGVNNVGFYSDKMKKMKSGPFSLRSYLFRIHEFDSKDVSPYLNITDNPLEIKVRTLKIPAATPVAQNETAKSEESDEAHTESAPRPEDSVKTVPAGQSQ